MLIVYQLRESDTSSTQLLPLLHEEDPTIIVVNMHPAPATEAHCLRAALKFKHRFYVKGERNDAAPVQTWVYSGSQK